MKRRELLILSIAIFMTVVASLAADIYHINTRAAVSEKIEEPKLQNYKIDKKLLEDLETREE
jgi:hypothetical protein